MHNINWHGRQKRTHINDENGSRARTGSDARFQNCMSGYDTSTSACFKILNILPVKHRTCEINFEQIEFFFSKLVKTEADIQSYFYKTSVSFMDCHFSFKLLLQKHICQERNLYFKDPARTSLFKQS